MYLSYCYYIKRLQAAILNYSWHAMSSCMSIPSNKITFYYALLLESMYLTSMYLPPFSPPPTFPLPPSTTHTRQCTLVCHPRGYMYFWPPPHPTAKKNCPCWWGTSTPIEPGRAGK